VSSRLTPRERVLRQATEADWQAQVVELARLRRWRVAHFATGRVAARGGVERFVTPALYDGAGFPDLVLVRPPRLLFVELKRQTGRTSPAQDAWLAALFACDGVECYVWRPGDWASVEEVLR
jgi:hypothetical protein